MNKHQTDFSSLFNKEAVQLIQGDCLIAMADLVKKCVKVDAIITDPPYNISKETMIAVLKKLGFAGVSETAIGAQEVSIQTAKMLNEAESGLFISSACPVIDDYIRLYKPKFVNNITPIASPALTHAGMLKDTYGEDIKVVVANALSILTSVKFNDNILNTLLNEEVSQFKEYEFNIFETSTTTESDYLESIENDIYEEEDDVHDSDLIN